MNKLTPGERTVLDLAAQYQIDHAEPCPLKHVLLSRPPEFADALLSTVNGLIGKDILEMSGHPSYENLHLTPAGLLTCKQTGYAAAVGEKLLRYLKRRLDVEGVGFKAFSWAELKGADVVASDDEFCLAVTVIDVLELSGGGSSWTKGSSSPTGQWGVPDDIVEMRTLKEIGDLESRALHRRAARDGFIRTRADSDGPADAPDLSDYRDEEQPWYRPVPVFPPARDHAAPGPADVLLVTATVEELTAVQRVLTPGFRHVLGQHIYYSGTLGAYHAVVFECAPGSMSRDAAALSAAEAIRRWRPKAVIVVGIAFGCDRTKQKIADVLVSSQVISYEQQRVGTGDPVPRGPACEAGPVLLSRFRDAKRRWDFRRPDGSSSALRDGPLLSGEKLVDNSVFLARLREAFPSAIGGEMEAAGVYAAASRHEARTEWIVVKGICDWGDGTKTDGYQPLAAAAAVSLVQFVLSDSTALASLPSPASQGSTARGGPFGLVEPSTPAQSTHFGIAEDDWAELREMNEAVGRLVTFYKRVTPALEKLDTDVRSFTQQVKSFGGAPQERVMAMVAAQRVLARKICTYSDTVEPLMPSVEADWAAVKRATPKLADLPDEILRHAVSQTFVRGVREAQRVAARTSSESAGVRTAIAGILSLDDEFTEAIKRLTTTAHWVSIEFDTGAGILADLIAALPTAPRQDQQSGQPSEGMEPAPYSGHTVTLPEVRWPPVLRDVQRTILEAIAEHWNREGTWPLRKRLRVQFAKSGVNLDDELALLSQVLWATEREGFSPDDLVALRVPGVALTSGGDAVGTLFVALMQLGIDRYMRDPFGNPTVTEADLREKATDGEAAKLARLGRVVGDELHASRFEAGRWSWEPRLQHVAFDGLTDIWEFVRRRERAYRDATLDIEGDSLLRQAYETWRTSGEWPQLARFVIEHRAHGPVLDWLIAHQSELWEFRSTGEADERLRLRVSTVARIEPDAPELDLFIRILKHVRDMYMEDPDVKRTDEDLAAALNMTAAEVRRAGEWFHDDYDSGVWISAQSEPWWVTGNKDLLQWDGLVGIEDYLKRRDARRKKTGWQ